MFRLIPLKLLQFFLLLSIATGICPLRAELRILASGTDYLRLDYTAGELDLQRSTGRSFLVGIPEHARVELEILEQQEATGLLPVPGGMTEQIYSASANLGEIGRLRDQKVVELLFTPKVTTGQSTTFFDRQVVELRFDYSPRPYMRPRKERFAEDFYRGMLVNSEQARRWRMSRTRRLGRLLQTGSVDRV